MDGKTRTFLMSAFALAAILPAADTGSFQITLGSIDNHNGGTTLSVGEVGLDSHAGGSYMPEQEAAPHYFIIPSERPFRAAPGVMLRIPLGGGSSQ